MNEFTFNELTIGQKAKFAHTFTEKDATKFADLSNDFNPLHTNKKYAQNTKFKGTILHGMLVASLLSTLVGIHLPGKYCLYLSQELQFRKPIRPNQKIIVEGNISNKIESLKIIEIETKIIDIENNLLITGLAKVKLLK